MSVMLFAFDAANQLIREDNGFINKTVTYTYDSWGNILTKSEYLYTTGTLGTPSDTVVYTYGNSAWGDQLTSYDGETISYDAMGNPVNYRGYATSFEGKQLVSAVKTGKNITFAYDENGLRTQKTVNNVTTNYYYNGSVLISQVSGNDTLLFSYDASGNVVSVNFNGTDYYYVRNGQGDVVKFIDGNGTIVTEYTYDTWGKLVSCTGSLASTLGNLNPFRYRGYVYDAETELYYLQTRYYDAEVGKFVNADVYLSTGQGVVGNNRYVYCNNNSVNAKDPTGNLPSYNVMETDGGSSVRFSTVEEVLRHFKKTTKKRADVHGLVYYGFIYYNEDYQIKEGATEEDVNNAQSLEEIFSHFDHTWGLKTRATFDTAVYTARRIEHDQSCFAFVITEPKCGGEAWLSFITQGYLRVYVIREDGRIEQTK